MFRYSNTALTADACTQQHLQGFYRDPQAIEQIAQRVVQSGALQQLASAWKLPVELASDLVKISLFDVVVLVDDSGSMAFEQGGERIEDLKSWVILLIRQEIHAHFTIPIASSAKSPLLALCSTTMECKSRALWTILRTV